MEVDLKRVVLAMSGGVDSSLSVYLLKSQGFEVIGVTFKMFQGQEKYLLDAEKVAGSFGIKWECLDKSLEFNETVVSYFINSYRKGFTPNPCAYCNRNAKFYFLFNELQKHDADFIATGHYARVADVAGQKFIQKGKDTKKDQSYYLALIRPELTDRLIFPLGNYTKEQVRLLAKEIGLSVAEKKDSQEVCFLEGGDYRAYLRRMIDKAKIKVGDFVYNGQVIGKHEGIEFYTVGQRRGLGIGYHLPLYVKKIDPESNTIYLTDNNRDGGRAVGLKDCNWFGEPKKLFYASARLRYKMKDAKALVEILPDNKAHLLFDTIQPFPAPGQMAAVYKDDILLGGGFIERVF
ncbi:MAG: tRNA 2-thiouridine(34) synthase MnmA [Calditerrivibrio sp.]|nr:tRNA 2-thiouridine(34) synthase MnmA [Calditerrivibrio sp.]